MKKNETKTKAAPKKEASAPKMTTHWEVHPIAQLFPRKNPEERAEMKKDMLDRAAKGLEPLESALLLYEGKLADGRHRDELWVELAEENAGNGYFKKKMPPTETLDPKKHGTLAAWMRAKSRNLVVRQTPADQRGAIFLKAVATFPKLKAVLEGIKQENLQRQKEGKPLDTSAQRGNTAAQIADLAGVGETTVKQVQKLQREAPEKFEEVAKGETTAKKALKGVKKAAQKKSGLAEETKETEAKGQRPKIADLIQVINRGLALADEAEALNPKANALFFKYRGFQVKVTCKIV